MIHAVLQIHTIQRSPIFINGLLGVVHFYVLINIAPDFVFLLV